MCDRITRSLQRRRRIDSQPMDFSLTADQREIQALARDVAQAEIEPNAAAWDREHRFPSELYVKLAELGAEEGPVLHFLKLAKLALAKDRVGPEFGAAIHGHAR